MVILHSKVVLAIYLTEVVIIQTTTGLVEYIALSNLIWQRDSRQLNQDHSLIHYVQQKTGIQDQEKAREYTHHALGILNEHANSNPNGLQSLFNNLLGL